MKFHWLNHENNKNLIVFFAGWSFDETPFKFLECKDYDVIIFFDYNNLDLDFNYNIFKNYKKKYLLTWSMGVFVCYHHFETFKDFDFKVAINGTISPVDDKYGIPKNVFELTLKHAQKGLEGKFYKNVFMSEEEFEKYSIHPVTRSIENRVSELKNLYEFIKNDLDNKIEPFYDLAIVSDFDKIIPPKNQIASHTKDNVPIVNLPYGHFPFYNFNSWDEILKCQPI